MNTFAFPTVLRGNLRTSVVSSRFALITMSLPPFDIFHHRRFLVGRVKIVIKLIFT